MFFFFFMEISPNVCLSTLTNTFSKKKEKKKKYINQYINLNNMCFKY